MCVLLPKAPLPVNKRGYSELENKNSSSSNTSPVFRLFGTGFMLVI
jgi:hypothetical protein